MGADFRGPKSAYRSQKGPVFYPDSDYTIPFWRNEILSRFLVVLKSLHKLYPMITWEKFHSGKARFHFCIAEILLCRGEIFSCNRFSLPKRDKKVSNTCLEKKRNVNKSKQIPDEKLPCLPKMNLNPHVIVRWNLFRLDGLKSHPGKPELCSHHLR